MKKIAIKGSQDSVERQEILEILRSWGGMNSNGYLFDTGGYYYLNYNNIISLQHGIFLPEFELLTLKEYKEKYMNKENNKELQIIAPEGYEIDKENSTFEKIVFKKVEEKLTYEKVVDKMFQHKNHYFIDSDGDITEASHGWGCSNVAPTINQLEKLLAINKLMNVAHYLNDGWEPDWKDGSQKFFMYYNTTNRDIEIDVNTYFNSGVVYFKSKKLAEQAIEILGKEIVKLALGV
jgi:hypothetical protein